MMNPAYRLLDAEEFFEIDFGAERKAELDQGVIRMMAGGTRAHARVQANLLAWLRQALRGSGCRPYGSDMAIKTGKLSVRYPDVSVVCGDSEDPDDDNRKSFDHASAIFEILSPSTMEYDQTVKLREYQQVDTVATIVLLDPESEQVRVVQRLGPQSWRDDTSPGPADVALPSLGLTIPHAEIFSRD
jgi:Uma2 family endonuclease